MRFANEWDIEDFLATHVDSSRGVADQRHENLARAAINLHRLAHWANTHSDGWAYWPKPCRSAAKLIEILESNRRPEHDISSSELTKALSPIKAMLTRNRAVGDTHNVLL